MLHEKLFLNIEFELYELANRSNLTIHECSRIINKCQDTSVPDWINKYRIDYFIETFPKKSPYMTVDAIALEAGFSSRSSFYRAFKKQKKMMPSDFFRQE
jgi:AraC-like DNA-binding protein